jgi:hypothetical protein
MQVRVRLVLFVDLFALEEINRNAPRWITPIKHLLGRAEFERGWMLGNTRQKREEMMG